MGDVICRSCGTPISRATKGVHSRCFPEYRVAPSSDVERYQCGLPLGAYRCTLPAAATGWCGKHAATFRRNGDPLHIEKVLTPCHYCPEDLPIAKSKRVGTDDKGNPVCRKHYARWQRHGDALYQARREPTMEHDSKSFWTLVDTRGGDMEKCWPWTGTVSVHGYGVWRKTPAHRMAYILSGGGHPEGNVVDHRCHDPKECEGGACEHRRCCNPTHLKSVTQAENCSAERSSRHRLRLNGALCILDGCGGVGMARTREDDSVVLCAGHYQRYKAHGPDFPRTPLRVKRRRTA